MSDQPTDKQPDNRAQVLQQLDGYWQNMACLLLWKLAGRKRIEVTSEEMAKFSAEFAPGTPTLFTHGHKNSLEFQVMSEKEALDLVALANQPATVSPSGVN